MDGAQFKVLADDYFMEMEITEDGETSTTCFLGIVSMLNLEYWLIGDVFLRGYYSIFDNSDHDAPRMGFAPHATSTKPKVKENATIPSIGIEDVTWELTWIFDFWYYFGALSFTQWYFRWHAKIWVWWFGLS